jgi:Carboxypeptidase regulatory-like domain
MHANLRFVVPRGGWVAAITLLGTLPCGAQRPAQRFTIAGRVVDSLVEPVAGAELSIAPLHISVTTDAAGRFHLANVPAGPFVLQVRKLGFGPVDVALLMPRDSSISSITLVRGAVLLRTVVTQTIGRFDKPLRLGFTSKYDEFYERRKYSAGSARFYTHEDIERMDVKDFIDILRRVPHLQMWDEGGNTLLRFPHCSMDGIMIKLDGNRIWPTGSMIQRDVGLSVQTPNSIRAQSPVDSLGGKPDPLDLLRPLRETNLEAVEVYPTSSSLPADAVGTSCAAIFVWTR